MSARNELAQPLNAKSNGAASNSSMLTSGKFWCCAGPGLVFVVLAIAIPFILQAALMAGLHHKFIVTSPDAAMYDQWTNFYTKGNPTYTSYRMFNLTNAWDVVNNGAKPIVTEEGPFVYEYTRKRVNVTFTDGGNEAEFQLQQQFFFRPDMSTGDAHTARICLVNPAWMGAVAEAGLEANIQPATIGGFISRFLQFFEGPLVDGLTSEATAPMLQTKSAALISKFTMETFVKAWASSTASSAPGSASVWKGMLVEPVTGSALGISEAAGAKLWNASVTNSLLDSSWTATQAWMNAPTDAAAMKTLTTAFTISSADVRMIAQWRAAFIMTFDVQSSMLLAKGYASPAELSFDQWSTGKPTNKQSVMMLYPGRFAMPPEFWFLHPTPISAAAAQHLFNSSSDGLLMNTNTLRTFFTSLRSQAGVDKMSKKYHLTEPQLHSLNTYMFIVLGRFGHPFLENLQASNQGIVKCATPQEWLFDDTDALLSLIKPAASSNGHFFHNNTMGQPWASSDDAVGFTTNTGKSDRSQLCQITTVNGDPYVHDWATPEKVQGTLAFQFHFGVTLGEQLTIWEQDLSRHLTLVPPTGTKSDQTVTVKGVTLYKYIVDPNDLMPNPKYYQTIPGFFNQSAAKLSSPIFVSWPHFNHAPSRFVDAIDGMPSPAADDMTILNIEPITGSTLDASKKAQVNVYLSENNTWFVQEGQSCPPYVCHPNIKLGVMYPMVWQDQAGELSDANANQLKHQVYLLKHLKIALPIVFAILAVLFIVMGVFRYRRYVKQAGGPSADTSYGGTLA